ncbi:hypothetical protein GCM10008986_20820 [Salinibacillus aidingensis]|uniref:Uncharacterized protein n=1 Tax=Salinibacillus aidingensis TaxID=237684 RepID=A0ABN1BBF1_9BACI
MFKNSMIYGLIFFVGFTIKDILFSEEIQWVDNIGISIIVFLINILWEWAKKPYDWNKNK